MSHKIDERWHSKPNIQIDKKKCERLYESKKQIAE